VPNYDEFVKCLEVHSKQLESCVENVYDVNGEIESFFQTTTYQTKYRNICFVSCENFDTKDNDYVQYRLLFVKN